MCSCMLFLPSLNYLFGINFQGQNEWIKVYEHLDTPCQIAIFAFHTVPWWYAEKYFKTGSWVAGKGGEPDLLYFLISMT